MTLIQVILTIIGLAAGWTAICFLISEKIYYRNYKDGELEE